MISPVARAEFGSSPEEGALARSVDSHSAPFVAPVCSSYITGEIIPVLGGMSAG